MKGFLILIIFIEFSFSLKAQNNNLISGIVLDNITDEPLINTNIFLSKTTIGTTSNAEGFFEIKNIPEGNYTLVISMIGYESYIKKIDIKQNSKIQLNIGLKLKAIELNTVEVSGDKSLYEQYLREQYEYRKIFKKYFLGQTEFAEKCEILNKDKIVFKKNTLGFIEAKSSEPIKINNNALGYKIDCVLENFLCNDKQGSSQMIFYFKFTEMKTDDENQREQWEENRERAYLSSLRRFLLSVKNDEVQKNRYGLFLTKSIFNLQSIPRAKIIYGSEKISVIDSVSNRTKLMFDEYLLVHNNMTDEQSWIKLPFGEAEITEEGYVFEPLSLTAYETFATHGVADALPDNVLLEK